ncbi:putative phage abortive infection protein [Rhodobacteraceae bacterium M382]|nr:putative phage abortive infection protein [Rhodobacteraceae bacterium M382]
MKSDSDEKDASEEKGPSLWMAFGLFILVCMMWGGNIFFLGGSKPDVRGTYGDMFGAINALFTGLAFAAVIYAIFLQKHEVRLLKSELKGTKRMMEKQQKLADVQLQRQRVQAFESTFFQYLAVFNQIVSEMDLKSKDKPTVTGKDVFPVFLTRVAGWRPPAKKRPFMEQRESGWMGSAYEKFYNGDDIHPGHASELGHYFRTLYNIFKYVHKSEGIDKRLYTNLIRAQLSDDEVMLLFLNGLSKKGDKFKPLLEEYAVLKNVDKRSDFYGLSERKGDYSLSAFGE